MITRTHEMPGGHPEAQAFIASAVTKGIGLNNAVSFATWITSASGYPTGLLARLDNSLMYVSPEDILWYQSGLASAFTGFLRRGNYPEFDVLCVRPDSSQTWMRDAVLSTAGVLPKGNYETVPQMAAARDTTRPVAIFDEWSIRGEQIEQQIEYIHIARPSAPIFVGVGIVGEEAQRRLAQLQQTIPNLHIIILDSRIIKNLGDAGFTQSDADFINRQLSIRGEQFIRLTDYEVFGQHKVSDTVSFVLRENINDIGQPILLCDVIPPYRSPRKRNH